MSLFFLKVTEWGDDVRPISEEEAMVIVNHQSTGDVCTLMMCLQDKGMVRTEKRASSHHTNRASHKSWMFKPAECVTAASFKMATMFNFMTVYLRRIKLKNTALMMILPYITLLFYYIMEPCTAFYPVDPSG